MKSFVKVCPDCGSDDLGERIGVTEGAAPYFCRKCGKSGIFFIEVEEEKLAEFRKNLKSRKN